MRIVNLFLILIFFAGCTNKDMEPLEIQYLLEARSVPYTVTYSDGGKMVKREITRSFEFFDATAAMGSTVMATLEGVPDSVDSRILISWGSQPLVNARGKGNITAKTQVIIK